MGRIINSDFTLYNLVVSRIRCHFLSPDEDEVCSHCGCETPALHVNAGVRVEDNEGRTLRCFSDGMVMSQLLDIPTNYYNDKISSLFSTINAKSDKNYTYPHKSTRCLRLDMTSQSCRIVMSNLLNMRSNKSLFCMYLKWSCK